MTEMSLSSILLQIWDRETLQCTKILKGHTGSVLCLQYSEQVIITGSSDSTIRLGQLRSLTNELTGDPVSDLRSTPVQTTNLRSF